MKQVCSNYHVRFSTGHGSSEHLDLEITRADATFVPINFHYLRAEVHKSKRSSFVLVEKTIQVLKKNLSSNSNPFRRFYLQSQEVTVT